MPSTLFAYPKNDLIAGSVVFLVALPLCLGIAVACGVPPISGLIAGIAGGLIVPWISRSPLSVSGPAAGLTSIVLVEVQRLGGLPPFLTAVMLAGGLQVAFGVLRAGRFAALVPSAVIKGMLASIGITIVLKQLPVAVGSAGGLGDIGRDLTPSAIGITVLSLTLLYGIPRTMLARYPVLSPALLVVVSSSAVAAFLEGSAWALSASQFVRVPLGGLPTLVSELPRPAFAAIASPAVWVAAVTIAVVASIETLLSLQAVDRLDPFRRASPADRELLAQGAANAASGFFGGLPLTAVIVRSGANVAAGGRERLSALWHGLLLVGAVLAAGPLLNRIPLAALAAILIQVGLNLCNPALFTGQMRLGVAQFLPFAITICAVLATDLLKGVIVGIIAGVGFVLAQNASGAVVTAVDPDGATRIRFRRDGTFLTKPALTAALASVPTGGRVVIDGSGEFLDHDVKETVASFLDDAVNREIHVRVDGIDLQGVSSGGGH